LATEQDSSGTGAGESAVRAVLNADGQLIIAGVAVEWSVSNGKCRVRSTRPCFPCSRSSAGVLRAVHSSVSRHVNGARCARAYRTQHADVYRRQTRR
jgi:hypothetical protein